MNIMRVKISDKSVAENLTALMGHKMSLLDVENLNFLLIELNEFYNIGKNIFYQQVHLWGGTMVPHSDGRYTFEDPALEILFKAEEASYMSSSKEFVFAPIVVTVAGVDQGIKDALAGIVTINE